MAQPSAASRVVDVDSAAKEEARAEDAGADLRALHSLVGELRDQLKEVSQRVGHVEQTVEHHEPTRSRAVTFKSDTSDSNEDDEEDKESGAATADTRRSRGSSGVPRLPLPRMQTSPRLSRGSAQYSRPASRSSTRHSSLWDPNADEESTPLIPKRFTVFGQALIASQISLPIRLLGIMLAFITVVLLWETTDLSMHKLFPKKEVRLVGYLGLAGTASVLLTLSHQWILRAHSSLVPSFAYSLSTLFLAIGSWGVIATSVELIVPERMRLFCWGVGGLLTLTGTVVYAMQTRHNVLLDIASCATTLGLHDEVDVDCGDPTTPLC